jgi:transposase
MQTTPQHGQDARRLPAWPLTHQGGPPRQMAKALGVSAAAVSPWGTCGREGGRPARRHRPSAGAPRRWAAEPLTRLPDLLPRGPEADGVRGHGGTRGRVTAGLRLAGGVASHPGPGGRLLKALRGSPPKPARRARQRDEAALAHGREPTGPALNRGRRSRHNAASAELRPVCLPCRVSGVPTRRWGRPPSGERGGRVLSSRPSAPCRQRARWTSTATTTPALRTTGSRVWSPCAARSPAPGSSAGRAPPVTAATRSRRSWRRAPPRGGRWRGDPPRPQRGILAREAGTSSQGAHAAMAVASIAHTCGANAAGP